MQTKTSNKEIRVFKSQELRADVESRTIRGYAAVFNSDSENLGGFIERIDPRAFDDVLEDDVRALINHDDNMILARTSSGTLSLSIDERGLSYEFEVPNTTYGNDLLVSVQRGDISQSSFGFAVAEDEWERGDVRRRTIKKVARLYDVSPVTYPAYPDTSVAMRSLSQFEAQDEQTQKLHEYEEEQAHLTRAIISKLEKIV